jgi:hypothetical protein
VPYIHYIKKHPQEESDMKGLSGLVYTSKMRTQYTLFSDKKKLKYIKEAEQAYDAFNVIYLCEINLKLGDQWVLNVCLFIKGWDEISESKQPFSAFLNKKEISLLLDSYGMPEPMPLNK